MIMIDRNKLKAAAEARAAAWDDWIGAVVPE
jgi:hypothetical protein